VNKHAYDGEKAFHGNPSGVDNTMATYGGVAEYKRGKNLVESNFKQIKLKKPFDVVISFSGKYSETAKMVAGVQKFKDDNVEEFSQLVEEYMNIERKAKKVLLSGDLKKIGELMNANQSLLSELGISDERNDKINKIALEEGASGAKVTGGGGGGCCIALANDAKQAKHIAAMLNENKFNAFSTKIGAR
jgi:mevalonate kinase